jgi:hypothetical protein
VNTISLVIAIILFILAALSVPLGSVDARDLAYLGLAFFATAHLPLP